jgi:hypothetical protein
VFCAQHRPTTLAEAERVIDELADVTDESPELVKSLLRELVVEYGNHTGDGPDPAPPRKAHAK